MRNTFQFNYINLDYVEEVSNGDLAYEKDIIALFISIIPQSVSSLIKQFELGSYQNVKKILHHMHSSTGIMGLNDKLGKYMDAIVEEDLENKVVRKNMQEISTVCLNAVEEAKNYLHTLE